MFQTFRLFLFARVEATNANHFTNLNENRHDKSFAVYKEIFSSGRVMFALLGATRAGASTIIAASSVACSDGAAISAIKSVNPPVANVVKTAAGVNAAFAGVSGAALIVFGRDARAIKAEGGVILIYGSD